MAVVVGTTGRNIVIAVVVAVASTNRREIRHEMRRCRGGLGSFRTGMTRSSLFLGSHPLFGTLW